ncbi:MAG: SRPBCC family protein [Bacteroidales bacterium]
MKALKIILISLGIILGILLIIYLVAPTEVVVERSKKMDAPVTTIFNQVNNLKNWEDWSPWHKIDPGMQITYEKEEGEGASYSWQSDHGRVGDGALKILESIPYEYIETEMNFGEQGIANGYYRFEEIDDSVMVTWGMITEVGWNPMGKFFGLFMDKMVGSDFEQGLENLAEVSKKEAEKIKGAYQVNLEEIGPYTFIGLPYTTTMDEIGNSIGQAFGKLVNYIERNELQMAGAPFVMYHSWSDTAVVMEPAIPVNKKVNAEESYHVGELHEMEAAVIDYYGAYDKIGIAHETMDEWLASNHREHGGPVMEVYKTDPISEPDTTKWLTKVIYPLK